MNTIDKIKSALKDNLSPTYLDVIDDSADHVGHAGNTGGGHYTVIITSSQFENLPLIKKHKMVYNALGDLMKTDIHALRIKVKG
ncbi:MAG: BolA family protein [Gammaproteobacteria bacterium]